MIDGNVFALKTPAQDPLNEVLKRGARELLARAVEAEVQALLAAELHERGCAILQRRALGIIFHDAA